MPDEPPYGEIAELLNEGTVVPFLGAGVNLGGRAENLVWSQEAAFLPSGGELSSFLAKKIGFPSMDDRDLKDLAKVASYFVETIARKRLRQRLRHIFAANCAPCDIHTYLASVAKPLLIVTTNYDDLTERAFEAAGRAFDVVAYPTDRRDVDASVLWWKHGAAEPLAVSPNKLTVELDTKTVIYKMHGTIRREQARWDSYVITEEDYVEFLSRMTMQTAIPAQFMRHFHDRHFLFLGYGLQDWTFRVMLKNLRVRLPARGALQGDGDEDEDDLRPGQTSEPAMPSARPVPGPVEPGSEEELDDDMDEGEVKSWAIQFRPSLLEQKLWSSRKVGIYDVEIDEFVRRLKEAAP